LRDPLSGGSLVRGLYCEYGSDLHLVLDAAARAKRDLPIAKTIGGQWDEALRAGFGRP
jgi:hypothetical protein